MPPPGAQFASFNNGYPPPNGGHYAYPGPGVTNAQPIPHQPMQHASVGTLKKGVGYFGQDRIVTTWVDQDEAEAFDKTPLERFAQNALEDSTFRVDYLFMQLPRPGYTTLGAQIPGIKKPYEPFTIGGGTAEVLTTGQIELTDVSGIQGTFTTPLTFATFEFSAFLMEQASDTGTVPNLVSGGSHFAVTPVTVNHASTFLLPAVYDTSYTAHYTSDIWGGRANAIINYPMPGEGVELRPLFGARFVRVHDHMLQEGVSTNAGGFSSHISSDAINNVYGPNAGFTLELDHRSFTIGVRPELMVGVNHYRNRVETETVLGPTDPRSGDELDETDFAAVGELALYGKVRLNDYISLYAAYTNLWLFRVQRADDIINYDTVGVGGIAVASNFQVQQSSRDMRIHGITVGGVITWK